MAIEHRCVAWCALRAGQATNAASSGHVIMSSISTIARGG
jgi:hypothetical protein